MRRRRRVTGRFVLLVMLLAIAIAAVVIVRNWPGSREETIFTAQASYQQVLDCVIVRDEPVTSSSSTVRVEYLAHEATEISAGETVANLFSTGYTESLLTRLETTRQNIQAYHKTLLGTIVDDDLDRLDAIIDLIALDFKNLATRQLRGNLQSVVEQLETSMVNRQEYLRQNKRDDTKLTKLYDEENTRLTSIQAWRQTSTASRSGVISFYMDGYETDLSPDQLGSITVSDIRTVLSGQPLASTADIQRDGLYRIVDQDKWYVAVLAGANVWTPTTGDVYYLQIEGFEDLIFQTAVSNVQQADGSVLAVFEINEPVGPLLYQRTGKVTLSSSLYSLAVRDRALSTREGQQGVWLYDIPGGTFVPVDVLYQQDGIAYIRPLIEGALKADDVVLVK